MAKNASQSILNNQSNRAILGICVLVGAYFLGSRAIDTGSWQQYGGTLLLLGLGLHQIVRAIRNT